MFRVRNKKKILECGSPRWYRSPPNTSLFINPSLCCYCKYLWSKFKALSSSKQISLLRLPNASLLIKLGHDTVISVSHKDDFKVFFHGNSILIDREEVFIFGSICCILGVFRFALHHILFFSKKANLLDFSVRTFKQRSFCFRAIFSKFLNWWINQNVIPNDF